MVDEGTWKRLSPAEQSEFSSYQKRFMKAVQSSGAFDGWDFGQTYQVAKSDGWFFLSTAPDESPFAGISSRSKAVVDALLTDAAQNYGR